MGQILSNTARLFQRPSSSAFSGRDSSLRDWILTHCQFLHSRILSVPTTTNSTNPNTLAAKAGRCSPNQSRRSPHICLPPPGRPTDLFPELESIRQQLLAPNDCLAWATGLRRLAAILTPGVGGGGVTEQSVQEIPSPFEMQHSGLLRGLLEYLTSSSDRKLRIYLLLMTFVGSRYTDNLHLRNISDNPKMLTALSKLSAHSPSEPPVSPFSALVSCLLVYLHQQEHFQVLTGPSLSPSTPNAESTSSSRAEEAISRMKSIFIGGSQQNCDSRSMDHEASGGSVAANGGHRNRRTLKSTAAASASKSAGRTSSNQRDRHPIRRWSSFVPGFLKLDLVYCRSSPSNGVSSSGVDSNMAQSSRSTATASPDSAAEALVKGTAWETPPSSIPLHVNALVTVQSLKQLLTQRIFLASLVSSCSSGTRVSEATANLSSSIPTAVIPPPHPLAFLQKHGTP
ncbi:unnamed protein product, partial [Dibothriocephalus latus]